MNTRDEHEYLALAAIADAVNAALAAGQIPDVESMVAEHPALEEHIRQLVPALAALHDLSPERAAEGPVDVLRREMQGTLGDFRILREVGRGGMGVVYEAEQISLGRRVALKVLPFAAVLDRRHLRRFQIEAQAAARLHHTHIVPVYGVGEERGVHYYAMQFVDGRTLSAVITELGEAGAKSPSDISQAILLDRSGDANDPDAVATGRASTLSATTRSPSFFRAAARLGIQAAEALEHAHAMGVIHRDVKPSNLMVDGGGQLWVTDFGLARLAGDPGMTLSGDILGTLRYMSPEQSLATRAPVDFHTDIYSLGATLYELLALRPALDGDDRRELLRRIGRDEPPPLRAANPAAPAELEVIVAKAMAKDPVDRYASAGELAGDLRRFLDDEPIRAQRPTLLQRARKWVRRHHRAVAAAVVVLLVAAAALTVSSALVWRAKERTGAALVTAEQARVDAEADFRRARRAVDRLLTRPAETAFRFMPGHVPLGRELLEQAVEHYESFLAARDDPEIRAETARLHRALAGVLLDLGRHEDALRASAAEIRLLEPLAAAADADPAVERRLAAAFTSRGRNLTDMRRLDQARQAFHKARELYAAYLAAHPEDTEARIGLATMHSLLGRLCSVDGKLHDAVREDRRAVAIAEEVCAQRDDDAGREAVALWRINLGAHLGEMGKSAEAVAEYEKARAFFADAVKRQPQNPALKSSLALAHYDLGRPLMRMGRAQAAEGHLRTSIQLNRDLRADFPSVPEYAYDWARSCLGLAKLLKNAGRTREASARLDAAVRELKTLAQRCPDVPTYRNDLSVAYESQHEILAAAGRPDEAEATLLRGIAVLGGDGTGAGLSRPQRERLARAHLVLATLRHRTGRLPEAEEAVRRGLQLYRDCGAESDLSAQGRRDLAAGHNVLGLIEQSRESYPKAEAQFRLGIEIMKRLASDARNPGGYRALRALLHSNLGSSLENQGRFKEAIEQLEAALTVVPGHFNATANLAWCLAAAPEAKLRDPARAEKLARDLIRQAPKKPYGWNALAVALFRGGKDEPAIRAIRKAADVEGTNTLYRYFVLAMAQWRRDQTERAGATFDEAVEVLRATPAPGRHLLAIAREAAAMLGRSDPTQEERSP